MNFVTGRGCAANHSVAPAMGCQSRDVGTASANAKSPNVAISRRAAPSGRSARRWPSEARPLAIAFQPSRTASAMIGATHTYALGTGAQPKTPEPPQSKCAQNTRSSKPTANLASGRRTVGHTPIRKGTTKITPSTAPHRPNSFSMPPPRNPAAADMKSGGQL